MCPLTSPFGQQGRASLFHEKCMPADLTPRSRSQLLSDVVAVDALRATLHASADLERWETLDSGLRLLRERLRRKSNLPAALSSPPRQAVAPVGGLDAVEMALLWLAQDRRVENLCHDTLDRLDELRVAHSAGEPKL